MNLLYYNRLACEDDIKDFILEGQANISFHNGCLQMENMLSEKEGQKANYVFWCPQEFPSDIRIEWDFKPITEVGLCMLFFAAKGRNGRDLFDTTLNKRNGEYPLYHHGDINAFHVSYYRRKELKEREFHTCNLRKSYGFHLVAQGADPIPDAADCNDFYHLAIERKGGKIGFYINDLQIFEYEDDGYSYGEKLGSGKIGFRQLAPLVARYKELRVYEI